MEAQTSSETIYYAYDDDNIRVSQTVNGETTSYLLDKNRPYAQVLAEYTNGNLDASYVYGLDLISQERGNTDSYYLIDGLGSTRGLTNSTGNVTDIYHYDAYGNLIDSVGNSENDYLFAGEQFDSNLDQYYLRQRYYDPSVGRFTRRDTYEGERFDPITLHKYLYAHANPVSYTDPSGLIVNPWAIAIGVGIGLTLGYVTIFSKDHFVRSNSGNDGELFDDPDDAAIAVLSKIYSNPGKYDKNVEHGGRICKSLFNGKYFYTKPTKGRESSVDPGFCPALSVPHGNYHTHGTDAPGEQAGRWPSESDYDKIKTYWYTKVGYVTTTDNEIIKYTPAHANGFITGDYGDVLKRFK